jgi:hypothetical protein
MYKDKAQVFYDAKPVVDKWGTTHYKPIIKHSNAMGLGRLTKQK